jgi:NAD(P)-dependent dehydrogenase (short-subunit alcohol dehydrogenase family)
MAQPRRAVLITGCDSGFGKSLAEKLDKAGQFLVLAGVFTDQGRDQYEGKQNIIPISVDVTSDQSVAAAFELVKNELARHNATLYGLVNNAGILTRPGPTEWQEVTNYERMMSVNLYGVVRMTNTFLPMLRNNQGRIVIVASIAGRNGLAYNSAYCASKHAVAGYAEVLRRDMIPWKVRVCVVEPGIFGQTGLYGDWQKGLDTTWKSLNPSVKEDYGETFYKRTRAMLGFVVKGMSNGDPDEVPLAMIDALTNPKPLRRYRPGRDSRTTFRALPLLPDHWVDTILTRPLGPPNFPAKVQQRTESHELYGSDTTSSIVVSSLIVLSSLGFYTAGRGLISRM